MEEDKIIERILNKNQDNASPCMKCGSILCAFCYEDLKKILFETLQKGKEIKEQEYLAKLEKIRNMRNGIAKIDSKQKGQVLDGLFHLAHLDKQEKERQASKIAELEEANNDYVNLNAQNLKRIVELELLNDQLTDANREHNKRIAELEETNKELEGQLSLITEVCKKKNLLDAVKIGKMATRKKDKRISELKKELQDLKVFREQLADELKIIISKINCELYEKHAGIFCKDYYNDNIKEVLFRWCYNCTNKKAGLEIIARLRGGK